MVGSDQKLRLPEPARVRTGLLSVELVEAALTQIALADPAL